jgi:hypothetical protein
MRCKMRTATLYFENGHVYIVSGINAEVRHNGFALALFRDHTRSVSISRFTDRPPQLVLMEGSRSLEHMMLSRLTLIESARGKMYACECVNPSDTSALLFVDTRDTLRKTSSHGTIFRIVSEDIAATLVSVQIHESADYGLIQFSPGSSCLIRSDAGMIGKITLSRLGVFQSSPCSEEEHAMVHCL